MKIQIVGASNWVNRMYEACGDYQWAREFLKNSLEAGATRVHFGIEWQAVEKLGVYRRTVIDNGCGMSADELRTFFSTLGEGAKTIGGVHDNFGVGAKIAALPWNPDGLVVISYKNNEASMIQIRLNLSSGEYELDEWEIANERRCVIDPTSVEWDDDVNWGAIKPEWVGPNGTVIVMLGSEQAPDTITGDPSAHEAPVMGLAKYLNSRFWDLSDCDQVTVEELRHDKKQLWPLRPDEQDPKRKPNNRHIKGAKYYLEDIQPDGARLAASGCAEIEESKVKIEWYLWEGTRPNYHAYASERGFIAVRYNGELFEMSSHPAKFRSFGVLENKVQKNLFIVLVPRHYGTGGVKWGVHPDQSRNGLNFTGASQKGVALPYADWGEEFADELPKPIYDAIKAARSDVSGSIEDETYKKRLAEKFGDRWTRKIRIVTPKSQSSDAAGSIDDAQIEVLSDPLPIKPISERKRNRNIRVLKPKASGQGEEGVGTKESPVDIPDFRWAPKENFDRPWHLASWMKHDEDGKPVVLINVESPILLESIKYHQSQYPPHYAEEVREVVQRAFGEIAVCKICHSQRLTSEISEEELDLAYRNEAALTVSLMGLLAEESVISQRLGKLGRKRVLAVANMD